MTKLVLRLLLIKLKNSKLWIIQNYKIYKCIPFCTVIWICGIYVIDVVLTSENVLKRQDKKLIIKNIIMFNNSYKICLPKLLKCNWISVKNYGMRVYIKLSVQE